MAGCPERRRRESDRCLRRGSQKANSAYRCLMSREKWRIKLSRPRRSWIMGGNLMKMTKSCKKITTMMDTTEKKCEVTST